MSLAALLAPLNDTLNAPLFTLWGTPTKVIEVLGFLTGATNVYLLAKQHLLNWPIGIANNALFLLIFMTSGLYADAGLQVVYITLAIYGWWAWSHGPTDRHELPVTRTAPRTLAALGAAGVVITAVLYVVLSRATNSTVPLWDAFSTALSLMATYGQCRKQLESWVIWMAVDLVYIPLYGFKGLFLTAGLYVVYFVLCVNGFLSWKRTQAAPKALEAAA